MKTSICVGRRIAVSFLAAVAAVHSGLAAVELTEPAEGAVVPTLTDPQKAYVRMPRAERREKFADSHFRKSVMGYPEEVAGKEKRKAYWPKTTRLAWTAPEGAECTVKVVSRRDGKTVFETRTTAREVFVDNLEIACGYTWSVSDGTAAATRSFTTEDVAPRLLRFPGIPNVRDLGGRLGRDGRRVKQGLVFRTGGLNENAGSVYYSQAELEATGKFAELETKAAAARKRLEQLKAWQAKPGEMDRSDPDYASWARRHAGETVAQYLSSRVAKAQKTIDECTKVVKEKKPGKARLDDAGRAYILGRFGIRSDIDLRSDGECYGMSGSPLGDSVTWFHYSSSAYGGMQSEFGRTQFTKVFRVFLDEKNYPIDFHCIAGQDRTGAVAFILNALLGVAEDELYLDWEESGFWNRSTTFTHEKLFDGLVKGFERQYPEGDIHAKVEAYVLSLGFKPEEIAWFREFMLEAK